MVFSSIPDGIHPVTNYRRILVVKFRRRIFGEIEYGLDYFDIMPGRPAKNETTPALAEADEVTHGDHGLGTHSLVAAWLGSAAFSGGKASADTTTNPSAFIIFSILVCRVGRDRRA